MRPRRWFVALAVVTALAACQGRAVPSPTANRPELTVTIPIPTTDKAVIDAAVDVMSKRLLALGIREFTSSAGPSLVFSVPIDGTIDRKVIDAVLRTPGVVSVIGWPGDDPPQAGDPAPTATAALFDAATQVTSALVDRTAEAPTIQLRLGPKGTAALASFTADQIGGSLVIVLDGKVLDSARVLSSISDGQLAVSFPESSAMSPEVIAAILESGPLPAGWLAP